MSKGYCGNIILSFKRNTTRLVKPLPHCVYSAAINKNKLLPSHECAFVLVAIPQGLLL